MEGAPTLTVTRTVVRFRQGGQVVKAFEVNSLELGNFNAITSKPHDVVVDLVEALIRTGGDVGVVFDALMIPPYVTVSLPPPPRDPGAYTAWRRQLTNIVKSLMSLDSRKSLLINFLESNRDSIIAMAVARGVSHDRAVALFNALLEEVRGIDSLKKVVEYERLNPVDYIVSRAATPTPG